MDAVTSARREQVLGRSFVLVLHAQQPALTDCCAARVPHPRPCRSRSRTSDPRVAAVAIESRMLTDAVPLTREITASTVHLCACMSPRHSTVGSRIYWCPLTGCSGTAVAVTCITAINYPGFSAVQSISGSRWRHSLWPSVELYCTHAE